MPCLFAALGDQLFRQRAPRSEIAIKAVQTPRLLAGRDDPKAAFGVDRDDQSVAGVQVKAWPEPGRQHQPAALTEGNGVGVAVVHGEIVPRSFDMPAFLESPTTTTRYPSATRGRYCSASATCIT